MDVEIKFHLDSNNPANAENTLRHMMNLGDLNFEILKTEKYLDMGCVAVCRYHSKSKSNPWKELVYELIQLCQSFGHGWANSGCVHEAFELHSNTISGGGISWASVYVRNPRA